MLKQRKLLDMKILNLLKENFEFDDSGKSFSAPKLSVSDLNSLQMRTLKRLRDGVVDLESASNKELDIILDLIELRLVDVEGNVNASGDEMSQPADLDSKYRTSDTSELDNVQGDDSYEEDDSQLLFTGSDGRTVSIKDNDVTELAKYLHKKFLGV